MHKHFTTLHCTYQSFAGNSIRSVRHLHSTPEPSQWLLDVLARYQRSIPNLKEEVLRKIIEMA